MPQSAAAIPSTSTAGLSASSSPADFATLHAAAGDACDYVAMKTEMLADLASGEPFSLLDVDLSWLEWPDIDLSAIFEWFDFS